MYDKVGRTIQAIDGNNHTTYFAYDKLGRLKTVTDANSGTVTYTYDPVGNRLSMTDPRGKVTTYEYDEVNRLKKKTEPAPNSFVTSYQYDEVGNLKQVNKPNGTIILYGYDALNRLTTVTYPTGTPVTLGYDDNGNRTSMTDGLGSQTFIYDELDRLTSQTDPFGNVVGYTYDDNGNRKTLTYPGNKVVTYGYDDVNRMKDVTDWLTHTTTYSYDVASRLAQSTLPNGSTATYGYDTADRLTSLANQKANVEVISSYSYVLDPVGNQQSETRTEPLAPNLTAGVTNYTADKENRLATVNGVAQSFDPNGNLISRPGASFTYDFEDRLVQRTVNTTNFTYAYDGAGNRRKRTESGSETRFVLDTSGSLSQVLAETDNTNAVTAYYVYGRGLISRITPAGAATYYHYDSRGSTVALTDQAGATAGSYTYGPYGEIVSSNGGSSNLFRFLGGHGVLDETDNLYFVRARYYDSGQQHFITKDTFSINDGSSQS